MPIEIEFIESSRVVHSRAPARLTDKDLLTHKSRIKEAFASGQIDATWRQIYDFSGVENVDGVSNNIIHALAVWAPIAWPKNALRLVIVPSDVTSALAHMYKSLGEPNTNRMILVNTLEEAMRILDTDGAESERSAQPQDQ